MNEIEARLIQAFNQFANMTTDEITKMMNVQAVKNEIMEKNIRTVNRRSKIGIHLGVAAILLYLFQRKKNKREEAQQHNS